MTDAPDIVERLLGLTTQNDDLTNEAANEIELLRAQIGLMVKEQARLLAAAAQHSANDKLEIERLRAENEALQDRVSELEARIMNS